jgi:putative transposase
MPEYRRYFVPGGTYFFTLVTLHRAPIFRSADARKILGRVMRAQCQQTPFQTVAVVLMPEHLHAIWTLPPNDDAYSARWQAVKAKFTSEWLKSAESEEDVSPGYRDQRRRGIWQPRFMEHTIRDEENLNNHFDYVHYNPVKHGYAHSPRDWLWSSFHRYVRSGDYPPNWGGDVANPPSFGDINEELLE